MRGTDQDRPGSPHSKGSSSPWAPHGAIGEAKDGFPLQGHQALPRHPTLATKATLGLEQRMLRCLPPSWDTSCIQHWCTVTTGSGCWELTQQGMRTKSKSSLSGDNLCFCTTQNQAGCFFKHRKCGKILPQIQVTQPPHSTFHLPARSSGRQIHNP